VWYQDLPRRVIAESCAMILAAACCLIRPRTKLKLSDHTGTLSADHSHVQRRVTFELKNTCQLLACFEIADD